MGVNHYAKLIYGVPFSEAIKTETIPEEVEITTRNPRTGESKTQFELRQRKVVNIGNRQYDYPLFLKMRYDCFCAKDGYSYLHQRFTGSDNYDDGILGIRAVVLDEYSQALLLPNPSCSPSGFVTLFPDVYEEAKKLLEEFGLQDKIGLHLMLVVS